MSGPLLGPRFMAALETAVRLHAPQTRKGTEIPYVSHPLAVAALVLEHGGDEDEAIAALLHDIIEDVRPIETARAAVDSFGPRVRQIVEAVSDSHEEHKAPWRQRKEAYLAHLPAASPSALLVSAADKVHNARTILLDLGVAGPAVFERFTAGAAGTLWYYRALVGALRANPASPPALVAELDRIVGAIEAAAQATPGDDWLDEAEAAAELRTSRPTIRRWAASGYLEDARQDQAGRLRVSRAAIEQVRRIEANLDRIERDLPPEPAGRET